MATPLPKLRRARAAAPIAVTWVIAFMGAAHMVRFASSTSEHALATGAIDAKVSASAIAAARRQQPLERAMKRMFASLRGAAA
jgi:hypothetical protein